MQDYSEKNPNNSIYEIREAIEKGIIEGIFKGNSLEIKHAFFHNYFLLVIPLIGLIFVYIAVYYLELAKYQELIIIAYAFVFLIVSNLLFNYLVVDIKNKQIFFVKRFLGIIPIYKSKSIYFKDIKCIGVQNGILTKGDRKHVNGSTMVVFGQDLSEEQKERIVIENCSSKIVAPDKFRNYEPTANAIADLIGVPCQICNKKQKLVAGRGQNGKETIIVIPYKFRNDIIEYTD